MPYTKSTQKKYGDNPMKKGTGFKMNGWTGFIKETPAPEKPKSMMDAEEMKVNIETPYVHPDSDRHIGAVPTFGDHIEEAKVKKKNKK